MMILLLLMFLCGGWVFCSNRKHLLIVLLSLEFIVLILYFSIYYGFCMFNYELYFITLFISFSVCEGALGLSILVSMVRSHGNDYFSGFGMLQC
uniref:NADH dehydrogenase subunit 4L n=1 Tax=Sorineuchora nigra TaxID=1928794 RepID=UPI00279B711C|nr:NADH dehydrogenase subunit 4L [Sorineuchora nigra]WGO57635.1 NADH dehydrogenase subunit 4L [Sorineuchora nigra]